MNFLTGLGDLAGGFAPYLSQYADQRQQDAVSSDVGRALMQQYGVTPPPQQQGGLAGLLSGLSGQSGMGSLMAPPPAQQQAMPRQAPLTAPQSAPAPMQVPTGNARSPLAPTQPMVAQPGGGLPSPQPAQATGGGTAALQAQQAQGARQAPQQQARPQPEQGQAQGQFSPESLIGALTRTPGMTPQRLGKVVSSPAFERLLTVQGLQQWRALQGALGVGRLEQGSERLGQQADQFSRRQESLDKYRGSLMKWRTGAATFNSTVQSIRDAARGQRTAIQNDMFAGKTKPEEAKAKLAAIDAEEDQKIKEAQKGLAEPPQDEGGGGGESAAGVSMQEALQQAKAAIAAGKPRDKIIERLKQHFPDADTSGL